MIEQIIVRVLIVSYLADILFATGLVDTFGTFRFLVVQFCKKKLIDLNEVLGLLCSFCTCAPLLYFRIILFSPLTIDFCTFNFAPLGIDMRKQRIITKEKCPVIIQSVCVSCLLAFVC